MLILPCEGGRSGAVWWNPNDQHTSHRLPEYCRAVVGWPGHFLSPNHSAASSFLAALVLADYEPPDHIQEGFLRKSAFILLPWLPAFHPFRLMSVWYHLFPTDPWWTRAACVLCPSLHDRHPQHHPPLTLSTVLRGCWGAGLLSSLFTERKSKTRGIWITHPGS